MARKFLFILVVTTVLISACSIPAATVIPTDSATAPTEAVKAVSTETDQVSSSADDDMMPGCTLTTNTEPQPTEESLFGPITESDWVIGPEDATVTLIEYSDFQ